MPRRRSRTAWFPPPSKPRPVEGGLRTRSRRGAIGETWWSRRFLGLLESFGIGGRLDRGKAYARKGQVVALDVAPGMVTATVQGSRARPYSVRIGLPRLSEADWRHAEAAMTARAAFLARLLAGEMPPDVEEAFDGCTAGLFPTSLDDFATSCSCPDWANPCKHVAAVYYLLGEAFDDDPFLLLRWRGRDRDELLANLRALRGTEPATETAAEDPWAEVTQVPSAPLDQRLDGFWHAGPAVAALRLAPEPPRPADAVLAALAPLQREAGGRPVADQLAAAYAAITGAAARRLLDGEDVGGKEDPYQS